MDESKKRKRASKPKVRTGCITCKIRRVKCDEIKPECERCTSTGRKCDGYVVPEKKSKEAGQKRQNTSSPGSSTNDDTIELPAPAFQLAPYSASPKERRLLDFFYHQTAPRLSGFFSGSFWNGSLPRLNLVEPTIRYATIALTSMYMGEGLLTPQSTESVENQRFGMEYYNKAIHSLLGKAKVDPEATAIFAIACIIFICLEFLRGNVDASLIHIESGAKMLKSWRDKHGYPKAPWGRGYSSFEADLMETELAPILSWLTAVLAIFGRPSQAIFLNPVDPEGPFFQYERPNNLLEARAGLVDIVNTGIKFTESIAVEKYQRDVQAEHAAEKERLDQMLARWNHDFETLIASQWPHWSKSERTAANLMRTTSLTAGMFNDVCLSPDETAWDKHKEKFEQIITLSEAVVQETIACESRVPIRFSFEFGIIPPLHFVAWKCRYPLLRRRVLKMLLTCPRRECLFDTNQFYALFLRVMELEEAALGLEPDQIPGENVLPPEHTRIHHFQVMSSTNTSNVRAVVFLSKSNGLCKPWLRRVEYIDMGATFLLSRSMTFCRWLPGMVTELPADGDALPTDRDLVVR